MESLIHPGQDWLIHREWVTVVDLEWAILCGKLSYMMNKEFNSAQLRAWRSLMHTCGVRCTGMLLTTAKCASEPAHADAPLPPRHPAPGCCGNWGCC